MDRECSFDELGEPLFSSRSSEIYEWKGNTLLKLFNKDFNPKLIADEEIITTEAFKLGLTKVNCYGHIQVGDRIGLILEKIPGDTLFRMILRQEIEADKATQYQVDLQVNKLHKAHTDKIRSFKDMAKEALDSEALSFLSVEERAAIAKRIEELPDGNAVLHLDGHVDNIMFDGKEATYIDWTTAARGVPAADVAMLIYLSSEAEMILGLTDDVAAFLENSRKEQLLVYLNKYKTATNISDEEIMLWKLPIYVIRLCIWNVESEVSLLRAKIRDELKKLPVGGKK